MVKKKEVTYLDVLDARSQRGEKTHQKELALGILREKKGKQKEKVSNKDPKNTSATSNEKEEKGGTNK